MKLYSTLLLFFPILLAEENEGAEEKPYHPVDATPLPAENEEDQSQGKKKKKKVVRYYDGVNPEVEEELKKVIDELEQRGIDKSNEVVN